MDIDMDMDREENFTKDVEGTLSFFNLFTPDIILSKLNIKKDKFMEMSGIDMFIPREYEGFITVFPFEWLKNSVYTFSNPLGFKDGVYFNYSRFIKLRIKRPLKEHELELPPSELKLSSNLFEQIIPKVIRDIEERKLTHLMYIVETRMSFGKMAFNVITYSGLFCCVNREMGG